MAAVAFALGNGREAATANKDPPDVPIASEDAGIPTDNGTVYLKSS